jgi:hypothetical protein
MTIFELQTALEVVKNTDAEIAALKKTDLILGMARSRELNIAEHLARLRTAVRLLSGTDKDSMAIRKTALVDLQRALSRNDNLLETKCRVARALRVTAD